MKIIRRNAHFSVRGAQSNATAAAAALEFFCNRAGNGLSLDEIQLGLVEFADARVRRIVRPASTASIVSWRAMTSPSCRRGAPTCTAARRARSSTCSNIQTHDITFGIGPAGTGKTYLAVACAVDALERDA